MNQKILNRIHSYYINKTIKDNFEVLYKKYKEKSFGFDYSVFDKTINYYADAMNKNISKKDALAKALNKKDHKDAWFAKEKKSLEDKIHFYLEVDIYPFRQPYLKRFGGFRWYRKLVDQFEYPSILEYGCGSAVLTEYLIHRYPNIKYTVADIPSVTLEFIKWKQKKYFYNYEILEIGMEGLPLKKQYDLIICQDVLEHTWNPLEIITSFVEHLSSGGVLVVDFINAPGGENLKESVDQREYVKKYLRNNLISLKAIDEPKGNNGLYVKYETSEKLIDIN